MLGPLTENSTPLHEAMVLLNVWDSNADDNLHLGYVVTTLGIMCSLGVSIFTDYLKPLHLKCLSFIAALCMALIASYHPIDNSITYRKAWRILYLAIVDYKANKDTEHLEKLIQAIKIGEDIISSNFQYLQTNQNFNKEVDQKKIINN